MSVYRLEIIPIDPIYHSLRGMIETSVGGTYEKYMTRDNENAGFDLFCRGDHELKEGQIKLIPLGIKAKMVRYKEKNKGVHYWLAPRSSIWKSNIQFVNSMGVIDLSYRGELMAAVRAFQDTKIENGSRICQILAPDMGWIKEVHIVDSLDDTKRGSRGFGSSG